MRVLSVTHGPSVPGGVFEEVVVAKGHELAHWSVPLGGAPQPPASYGAVMVFGGSMHPDHDEHFPWLESEAGFLERVLTDDIPVIVDAPGVGDVGADEDERAILRTGSRRVQSNCRAP